jgi:uncharacterized membrane protein
VTIPIAGCRYGQFRRTIRVSKKEATVPSLDTTVAVYDDVAAAETDWSALEEAAQSGMCNIADAALVQNNNGEVMILQRQSHHGWGKGVVVGAIVGVLFPPSLLGAAAVGAGGGALVSRMTRSLGRGKVKDLGEILDSGTMAIIVVSPTESTNAVCNTLKLPKTTATVPSASSEEIQEVMKG